MPASPRHVLSRFGRIVLGVLLAVLVLGVGASGPALAASGSPSPSPSGSPATPTTPGGQSGGNKTGPPLTFGIQPSSATSPDARPVITWAATPGGYLTDHVALLNYSEQPLTLKVYPTDAVTATDGSFGLIPSNQKPTQAGSWISVQGPKKLLVPARSADAPGVTVVPISAQIPNDAVPGDHSAGIVAVLTSFGKDKNGEQVKLEQRVGTRVFIRVSGDLTPRLSVSDLHASYQGQLNPTRPGTVLVTYTLTNAGNANVSAVGSTTISGLFGSRTVASNPRLPLLLPGARVQVSVVVPDVWPAVLMKGSVTVRASAVAGDTLPNVPLATASTTFWAIPWGLLLILVLLVLLAVGWWWQRRKTREVLAARTEPADDSKAKV